MKYQKLHHTRRKVVERGLRRMAVIGKIVRAIAQAGGRALLVGGAVRDLLLGLPAKDWDIEVHGLRLKQLEQILRAHGPIRLVGKAFGVLRLDGLDIDWSLPRTEGAGRKPKVSVDPHLSFKKAFARRDLTINAMGVDLQTFELIDPYDGQDDLKNGLLRAPDPKRFVDDPLRLFRVMQFISRFEMQPDRTLDRLCKAMNVREVSVERIEDEFNKMFVRSRYPSLGLRWLQRIGRTKDVLPELHATVGVPQHREWHPEGDVFEHTMQTIDAAAVLKYPDDDHRLTITYAALCHDLGKVTATKKVDGRWRSIGHAHVGVEPSKRLLKRISKNKERIAAVCKLVKYHMEPLVFIAVKAKSAAYKRLANKLAPQVTLQMLAQLSVADKRGRNPNSWRPLRRRLPDVDRFLRRARTAQVLKKVEKPVLLGRDLLDIFSPGPELGRVLKKAYELQLEHGIKNKKQLRERVLRWHKRYGAR